MVQTARLASGSRCSAHRRRTVSRRPPLAPPPLPPLCIPAAVPAHASSLPRRCFSARSRAAKTDGLGGKTPVFPRCFLTRLALASSVPEPAAGIKEKIKADRLAHEAAMLDRKPFRGMSKTLDFFDGHKFCAASKIYTPSGAPACPPRPATPPLCLCRGTVSLSRSDSLRLARSALTP